MFWRGKKEPFQLDFDKNVVEFHVAGSRDFRGGRSSGGMSLLIWASVVNLYDVIHSETLPYLV